MTDHLKKLRDELAEAYKQEDFNNNPNGYTVAPYVNSETTSTAFESGFDAATKELMRVIEILKEELENAADAFGGETIKTSTDDGEEEWWANCISLKHGAEEAIEKVDAILGEKE